MGKKKTESPTKFCEMIDESDSSEDSDDEDYELGDNLFSKKRSKRGKGKRVISRKSVSSVGKSRKISDSGSSRGKNGSQSDDVSDNLSPPTTSRLFQIVIARKHARLSSCLQRVYLSLKSEDKYVTIAEILSFICECAGFKPNLINHKYLVDNSGRNHVSGCKITSCESSEDFGWDSFRKAYSELPSRVTYEDLSKFKGVSELEDDLFYGYNVNFEHGDSISHKFYSMCNNHMKILGKKLDVNDGWMIDFGGAAFERFCEFFNELILQVEMGYFEDLVLLIQWIFVFSLCSYRSIRFLSCVACNEILSSLLHKFESLKKDQFVLGKQLSVESELDRRAAARIGGDGVNISGSTLDLYKRLVLVDVTCLVISALVKAAFYINYSSKAFDVFQDIKVLSSYYQLVHYLINPAMQNHVVYLELVGSLLLNQDDNLPFLLKYLVVYKNPVNSKIVDKLLKIYPHSKSELNRLIEFIFLKFLSHSQTQQTLSNTTGSKKSGHPGEGDKNSEIRELLFDNDFMYDRILNGNGVYFSTIFLLKHFPDYRFNLKFNLNLTNVRNKYSYLINPNNKVYNNYVYHYTSHTELNPELDDVDNMSTLCDALLIYKDKSGFDRFVDNLVESLIHLNFFDSNLVYLKYSNYLKFTHNLDKHTLFNYILLSLLKSLVNRVDELECSEFFDKCDDLYKLNKSSINNLEALFLIYNNLIKFNIACKFKLVDLILNRLEFILKNSKLLSITLSTLSTLLRCDNTSDNTLDKVDDKYKRKVNSVFHSNLVKFIDTIQDVDKGSDLKLVLFILNSFLTFFNFITLSEEMILKVFQISPTPLDTVTLDNSVKSADEVEILKSNGLYGELLILYYLIYEHIIYNIVNKPKYNFNHLPALQHKLILLLLDSVESTDNQADLTSVDDYLFVILSTVFNMFKLSNNDFLKNSSYKFTFDVTLVDRLESYLTRLLLKFYESLRASEVSKEAKDRVSRASKVLNLMNDGSVTVNYKYYLQQSNHKPLLFQNDSQLDTLQSSCVVKDLNIYYIVESLTYQYTKTLSVDLFNTNLSVLFILNTCSGLDRVVKASLKFLEVLNKFNLTLFNLLILHTMFTLYELSQIALLDHFVGIFNQFENAEFPLVVFRVCKYISKSQSNEKFQRCLNLMACNNINVLLSKHEDEKYSEILHLIKWVQGNVKLGKERYDVKWKINKVVNTNIADDDFNHNLLVLRRSLDTKSIEEFCTVIQKNLSRTKKKSKRVDIEKVKESVVDTDGFDETTLNPNEEDGGFFNKFTSNNNMSTTLEDGNDDESPKIVRNYAKKCAPSFGIRGKIEPIELRDDGIDLDDLETFDEFEPVYYDCSQDLNATDLDLKSTSLHKPKY